MSDGLPARRASMALLEAVLERDRTLEEAIAESVSMRDLEPRDRGFARLTVLTVLRHLGQIDSLIGGYMERPPVGRAQRALNILHRHRPPAVSKDARPCCGGRCCDPGKAGTAGFHGGPD